MYDAPWYMLFIDNIVLIDEIPDDINNRLEIYRF